MAEMNLVIDERPTAPLAVPLDPYADDTPSRWSLIAATAGAVSIGAAILCGRKIVQRPFATLVAVFFAWGALAAGSNLVGQTQRHPGPLFARAAAPAETTQTIPERREATTPQVAAVSPAPQAPPQRERREIVRDIQGELALRNHYQGTVDGLFGPRTERAIRAAEREIGVPETGQPSEALLARLRAPQPTRAAATPTPPTSAPRGETAAPTPQQTASVQRRLAEMGYAPGRLDGRMTPDFQRAIERFQRDHDLEPTGRVDRAVVERLTRIAGPMS